MKSLHSNLVIFQSKAAMLLLSNTANFTFQSDYIPIKVEKSYVQHLICFTFQSGYIPMVLSISRVTLTVSLHSNLVIFQYWVGVGIPLELVDFTFQSGYIPIMLRCVSLNSRMRLYIPIWLYSNQGKTSVLDAIASLHSNLVIFQSFDNRLMSGVGDISETVKQTIQIFRQQTYVGSGFHFTFQSGYIPIGREVGSPESFLTLHSNLVIFQFSKVHPYEACLSTLHSNLVIFQYKSKKSEHGSLSSLHSNLVIFQSLCVVSSCHGVHLYIPIWLYSN